MLDTLNEILKFLDVDIYQFFVELVAYLIEKVTIFYLKWSLSAMSFAWDVAQQILIDLNISQMLSSIWNNFNSEILDLLLWLKIPDFINTVLTAYVTRFVMHFIPGL